MINILDFTNILLQEKANIQIDSKKTDIIYLDIINEINNYLAKSSDSYYLCDNHEIINTFKLSWNEIDSDYSDLIPAYLVGLYLKDILNFETYRAILQNLFKEEKISHKDLIVFFWVNEILKNIFKKPQKISYLSYLHFSREIGFKPIFYSDFSKYYSELKLNTILDRSEEELCISIERTSKNLLTRHQYIEELANSVSSKVLNYLDFFVDFNILSDLSYNTTKTISQKHIQEEKTSIAQLEKEIELLFESEGHPPVPMQVDPVFQPHLSKIEAKSVNIEEVMKFPKEMVQKFAVILAYSSPKQAQKIKITFLGGGGIGNMGIVIQHNNNAILLDCGFSVANYAIPRWHPALRFVSTVLVSHAHLDHTGCLPYFISPENGKNWYASESTKLLTSKLLYNTTSIIKGNNIPDNQLTALNRSFLQESNLVNLFNVFHKIKAKETIEISPGFEITPYPAAHIFGSFGFDIDIFGKRIFFTGDFSLDGSELFQGARFPIDSDLTIFDGTYYNREINAQDPNVSILQAVEGSKRLIIPAFSIGRSQEMLKRLERLRVTKKHKVKVVGMSADITKLMGVKADYSTAKTLHPEDFEEGDIIIAGNGMLQGGTARRLLEATREDSETGVLLCGYQAPNTLGYALRTSNPISSQLYQQNIYNAQISGHTSAPLLDEYIENLNGKKIMVHTPKNTVVRKEHKNVLIPSYFQTITLKY